MSSFFAHITHFPPSSLPPFFVLIHRGGLFAGELHRMWKASRICMSASHRGRAHLLFAVPLLVYVPPQRAPHPLACPRMSKAQPFPHVLYEPKPQPALTTCLSKGYGPEFSPTPQTQLIPFLSFLQGAQGTSYLPVYPISRSPEICQWRGFYLFRIKE